MDSSFPTRAGRHGTMLLLEEDRILTEARNPLLAVSSGSGTGDAVLRVPQGDHRFAHDRPIQRGCQCYTCRNYSLAYLHHLYKMKEVTATVLGTVHNLHVAVRTLQLIRTAILEDRI